MFSIASWPQMILFFLYCINSTLVHLFGNGLWVSSWLIRPYSRTTWIPLNHLLQNSLWAQISKWFPGLVLSEFSRTCQSLVHFWIHYLKTHIGPSVTSEKTMWIVVVTMCAMAFTLIQSYYICSYQMCSYTAVHKISQNVTSVLHELLYWSLLALLLVWLKWMAMWMICHFDPDWNICITNRWDCLEIRCTHSCPPQDELF